MTIAISIKINDGVVLAADSASTLIGQEQNGTPFVVTVYNNANKVFNLRKGLPIGLITWGVGAIGTSSISTLVKDLRTRLEATSGWQIDPEAYTIQEVAEKVRRFMFEEKYLPAFGDWPQKPVLGFTVAGYSAGQDLAEEYQINIADGACSAPTQLRLQDDSGLTWNGEPEAIARLILGFSPNLLSILTTDFGLPPEQVMQAEERLRQRLILSLVMPAMPIQDAIDLAEFLVDMTIKVSRFTPGAATVGGPIEIAAITKHEGFRWIRRKHYFHQDLNRKEI